MRKEIGGKSFEEDEDLEEQDLQQRETELRLDVVEQCAIDKAFDANGGVRDELMNELGLEKDLLKFIAQFEGAKSIVLYPRNAKNDIILCQMAKVELKRLLNGGKTHCRHSVEEHKRALQSIIRKLPEQAPSKAN